MCNLYSIATNQEAIRALFRVMNRYVGNLAPCRVCLPIIPRRSSAMRAAGACRHRRAMAASDQYPQHLVATLARLAEAGKPLPRAVHVVWFAINDDRPLICFAGIWTEFKGDRGAKSKPIPGPHKVYGFLTTALTPSSSRSIRRQCR
jgi:putative SOS response-associated peptidase YedK